MHYVITDLYKGVQDCRGIPGLHYVDRRLTVYKGVQDCRGNWACTMLIRDLQYIKGFRIAEVIGFALC